MTLITKLQTKLENEGLKESSIKTHIRNLQKIINETGIKKINEKNKNKVVKGIEEMTFEGKSISNNTKASRYKTLLVLLRNDDNKKELWSFYNQILKEKAKLINNKQKENKFTEKEIDNLIKWKKIKKIKTSNLNEKIFHSLLVNDNLFLRLEVFNIKLDEYNTTTDNYINGSFLFMNDFKNVAKLGKQKFDLSNKTTDIIEEIKGSWLMTNHATTHSNKSMWIKNFFFKRTGKKINQNLLRKIYINEVLKKNLSTNQFEELARKMLNTFTTWNNNYRKVN